MSDERGAKPSIKLIVCLALTPFVLVPAAAAFGSIGEREFALFAGLPWLTAFCLSAVRAWRQGLA
jgi:hypothetical protein